MNHLLLHRLVKQYRFVLGSASPRRKELFSHFQIPFEIRTTDSDETWPIHLSEREIAPFLAEQKANYLWLYQEEELLITADTIVCLDGKVLNKPNDFSEAKEMLNFLSGKKHRVFTGVCIQTTELKRSFVEETTVEFKSLTAQEIDLYIQTFQPFDKAGSYGIQEWMGYFGISRIEGDFFNVMGLPLNSLYMHLLQWQAEL